MKNVVRTHRVENRLSQAISIPGGVTVSEAIEQAAQGVEELRAECMAALDAKIAEIEAATVSGAFDGNPADMARIYTLANEILSEAGAFGLSELSEAGRSLCELTSNWRDGGIGGEPIRVHVAAMKSLRRWDIESNTSLRMAVLDGLRQVTAKLSAQVRIAG
ncbi:MAG TPA: hypothetical protein VEA80_06975 [Vitreimonas sp.]|uniref:hypothetical protein n=1 Tax=Vitreimonas sp. TaxID=3069702 RepID=UPI002D31F66A|nr:hypothetical protein [Vitreimonas sp.]HYD87198.1 hypothetical protein [Vitreimonas sp.]